MTQRKNPFDSIRGRLRNGDGWMKQQLWDRRGPDGQTFCLVGAAGWANAVAHRNHDESDRVFDILANVIEEQYAERLGLFTGPDTAASTKIITFNDAAITQWPDVDKVLDKCKVRWEEGA